VCERDRKREGGSKRKCVRVRKTEMVVDGGREGRARAGLQGARGADGIGV